MSLIINFDRFLQFCLREKCIFHWGQEPGGVVARIPGCHPSYPGSIPGQGIKISFHATTHCRLSELKTRVMSSSGEGEVIGFFYLGGRANRMWV